MGQKAAPMSQKIPLGNFSLGVFSVAYIRIGKTHKHKGIFKILDI